MTYLETMLIEKLEKLEARVDELEKKLVNQTQVSTSNFDPLTEQFLNDIDVAIASNKQDFVIKKLKVLRADVISGKEKDADRIYHILNIWHD